MGGFTEAARERIHTARTALTTALEAEDPVATAVAQDELDDALRMARRHGIGTE
ncbi:hypothetical protein [Streptomyces sp. NPDC046909]|uniref:hypothetical protein n=1 Tax=Streptomyces sp. NPDC046909 TaxID=3155617 RepID=UPI0033D6A8FD